MGNNERTRRIKNQNIDTKLEVEGSEGLIKELQACNIPEERLPPVNPQIRAIVYHVIAKKLSRDPLSINPEERFSGVYGSHDLNLVEIHEKLEEELGIEIEWDKAIYCTRVRDLVRYVSKIVNKQKRQLKLVRTNAQQVPSSNYPQLLARF